MSKIQFLLICCGRPSPNVLLYCLFLVYVKWFIYRDLYFFPFVSTLTIPIPFLCGRFLALYPLFILVISYYSFIFHSKNNSIHRLTILFSSGPKFWISRFYFYEIWIFENLLLKFVFRNFATLSDKNGSLS